MSLHRGDVSLWGISITGVHYHQICCFLNDLPSVEFGLLSAVCYSTVVLCQNYLPSVVLYDKVQVVENARQKTIVRCTHKLTNYHWLRSNLSIVYGHALTALPYKGSGGSKNSRPIGFLQ